MSVLSAHLMAAKVSACLSFVDLLQLHAHLRLRLLCRAFGATLVVRCLRYESSTNGLLPRRLRPWHEHLSGVRHLRIAAAERDLWRLLAGFAYPGLRRLSLYTARESFDLPPVQGAFVGLSHLRLGLSDEDGSGAVAPCPHNLFAWLIRGLPGPDLLRSLRVRVHGERDLFDRCKEFICEAASGLTKLQVFACLARKPGEKRANVTGPPGVSCGSLRRTTLAIHHRDYGAGGPYPQLRKLWLSYGVKDPPTPGSAAHPLAPGGHCVAPRLVHLHLDLWPIGAVTPERWPPLAAAFPNLVALSLVLVQPSYHSLTVGLTHLSERLDELVSLRRLRFAPLYVSRGQSLRLTRLRLDLLEIVEGPVKVGLRLDGVTALTLAELRWCKEAVDTCPRGYFSQGTWRSIQLDEPWEAATVLF